MGRRPNGASNVYKGADGDWHGRVTVGIKDNGKPDRRHVQSKSEAEVIRGVRVLEKERDSGTVRKPGQRWTAATVLLLLGVPERAVIGIMGWSNGSMAMRYQHLTAQVRDDIAKRVGGLLWAVDEAQGDDDGAAGALVRA